MQPVIWVVGSNKINIEMTPFPSSASLFHSSLPSLRGTGGWSAPNSYSLLLLPPHTFPCSGRGSPQAAIPSGASICSTVVSSMGCRLRHHGAPSSPLTLVLPLLFLLFFSLPLCLSSVFCPFLDRFSWMHHQFGWWAQLRQIWERAHRRFPLLQNGLNPGMIL